MADKKIHYLTEVEIAEAFKEMNGSSSEVAHDLHIKQAEWLLDTIYKLRKKR